MYCFNLLRLGSCLTKLEELSLYVNSNSNIKAKNKFRLNLSK